MVGLLDICPQPEKFRIDKHNEIDIYGISARGIAALLTRFPTLLKIISRQEVESVSIAAMAPEAIVAIIAAGTGFLGNKEAEDKIADWPLETQKNAIKAIGKMTFPSGLRPFVADLDWLREDLTSVDGVAVPPPKSPSPPSPSAQPDIPQSGT